MDSRGKRRGKQPEINNHIHEKMDSREKCRGEQHGMEEQWLAISKLQKEVARLQDQREEDVAVTRSILLHLVPKEEQSMIDEKVSLQQLSNMLPLDRNSNDYYYDKPNIIRSTSTKLGGHIQNNNDDAENPEFDYAVNTAKKREFDADVFSFLLISNCWEKSHIIPALTAWLVFAFQISTYCLIILNVIDRNENGNVLNFPHNVDGSTRIAELVAIIITVVTQSDFRSALRMAFDSYQRCKFVSMGEDVSFWSWLCCVCARGFEGISGIGTTFLLIMQSNNVIDLLLNFSAIEFVSIIDDAVFILAIQGFLGPHNRQAAFTITNSYYYITFDEDNNMSESSYSEEKPTKGSLRTLLSKVKQFKKQAIFFAISLFPLLIGFLTIFYLQLEGEFSCEILYVQFDDLVDRELGRLSGTYIFEEHFDAGVSYKLDVDEERFGTARFQYCWELEAWTFKHNGDDSDACKDWVVRSTKIEDPYNILAAATLDWFVQTPIGRDINVKGMQFFCYECEKTDDMCNGQNGVCESNTCICEQGFYGRQCGFREPCQTIEIDTRFGEFISDREFATAYQRLRSSSATDANGFVDVQNRPVYYNHSKAHEFDIIMFNGRRWYLTTSNSFDIDASNLTVQSLASYIESDFNSFWSNYTEYFYSSAVEIDSPTDLFPSPIQLQWFESKNDVKIDLVFLCAECDNVTNPCLSGGICGGDSRCDCSNHRSSGSLCQIPPLSDGFCDPYFNYEKYGHDGGDCCQATCVSSEFKCGHALDEETYIGYANCKDPDHSMCPEEERSCWLRNSNIIDGGIDYAESGFALALSTNGRILAVGEPGIDTVRVFKSDGSQWIQLGDIIQGETDSRFGESIAISGDGKTLVVGAPDLNLPDIEDFKGDARASYQGGISVFEFRRISWIKIEDSPTNRTVHNRLKRGRLGASLAMSKDSKLLFLGFPFSSREGAVAIFLRDQSSKKFFTDRADTVSLIAGFIPEDHEGSLSKLEQKAIAQKNSTKRPIVKDEFPIENLEDLGKSISISDSGNVVAIGGKNSTTKKDVVIAYRNEQILNEAIGSRGANSLKPLGPPFQGCCGILSGDGKVLVVSSTINITCQVYSWEQNINNADGRWIEQGDRIDGIASSLSFDGSVVAVLMTNTSSVSTYFWNEQEWSAQGTVTGAAREDEVSVLLSSEKSGRNTHMAVALPLKDFEGSPQGVTSVYHLKSNLRSNVHDYELRNNIVRVEVTTDANPHEIIWELRDPLTKKILMSGGPYRKGGDEYSLKVKEVFLPSQSLCGEFSIYDIGGDGICCTKGLGSYSLYFGNNLIKTGWDYGWSEQVYFGDCGTCVQDESLFFFELKTDDNPKETSWILSDRDGSVIHVIENDTYMEERKEYGVELCLTSKSCFNFTILDTYGDGICCNDGFGKYVVSLDGKRIVKGGDFQKSETTIFGSCSQTNETSASEGADSAQIEYSPTISCEVGFSHLVVNVSTDSAPEETRWFLHTLDFNNNIPYFTAGIANKTIMLEGGPYNEEVSFSQELCIRGCALFAIFDFENNGISDPGGFSLLLDGKTIKFRDKFTSDDYIFIGDDCGDVIKTAHLSWGEGVVICNDDLGNSCKAPSSCAYNGISITPSGTDVGEITFEEGIWQTVGAYSLSFGSTCDVEISGDCYSSCNPTEMAVLLLITNPQKKKISFAWKLTNEVGHLLDEGAQQHYRQYEDPNIIIVERICVVKNQCVILTLNSWTNDSYIVHFGGHKTQSGAIDGEEVILSDSCSPVTSQIISNPSYDDVNTGTP